MNRTAVSPVGFFTAAVLYVAVNTLLNVMPPVVRMDVTEDGLYTLSQGTHRILSDIDEPIELHFFVSEQLGREVPVYASYGRRIRELLVEITVASDGKIILREYAPKPFSDDEDKAVSFGIQGVPVDQNESFSYFGLAGVNAVDDVESIPFFRPEQESLLEYNLARMIYRLSNVNPVTVGVISSLPIMGDMNAQGAGGMLVPWEIGNQLKENYDVVNLPESIDALPAEVDVLMIVHPRALSARAIYEIEQFLFRGGRAILFIDPKAESDVSLDPDDTSASTDGLQPLLRHWGVRVTDGQLVGDRSLALRINAGSVAQPVPADFLVWLGVADDNMSQTDPVTSQLFGLNLASAGFIMREDNSPFAVEPLIFSSPNSSPVATEKVRGLIPDVLGLLEDFKPDEKTYVMAARLTGNAATAFPEGPPAQTIRRTEQELAQNPPPAQLMESDGPVNIVVVADSDLLADRFWLRKRQFFGREVAEPIASNADFVVNALGNLAGSDALLTLRTRGLSRRPFERVRALQRRAESRLQDRERVLRSKLKEVQDNIAGLEGVRAVKDAESGEVKVNVSLTGEQRSQLESLRRDMLSIRQQLRGVQRGLREDVERLETWLRFINIGLIPLIVSAIAVALGVLRMTRARHHYRVIRERPVS